MVAGNREDGPVVGAKRLVELIVVVLILAEVVDDVTEVEEERWSAAPPSFDVLGHPVGHAGLVGDRLSGGLRYVHLGGARVADGVEGDLLRLDDRRECYRAQHVREVHAGRGGPGRRYGLDLLPVKQVVRRRVVLSACVVDLEGGLVRARLRVAKDACRSRSGGARHRLPRSEA